MVIPHAAQAQRGSGQLSRCLGRRNDQQAGNVRPVGLLQHETHGSGHIGRAIVDELLGHSHEVINADRQPSSGSAPLRLTDLEDLGQVMSVLAGCDAVVQALLQVAVKQAVN